MTTLSLVMMVKNEADLLPGFLKHHAGLTRDIVVVDTGSTDASRDLARLEGAEVLEIEWDEDFSAARNTGLTVAQGDWILILDADEMVDESDFGKIQNIIEGGEPALVIQETVNYCPDPTHLEWRPVSGRYPRWEAGQTGYFSARRAGLFPNRPDLRFSGRIHESILPAGREAGLSLVESDIPVHHFGYVRSSEVNAQRKLRYLKLAERKVADDPRDWGAILELATAHLETGGVDAAIALLEKITEGPAGLRPVVRGYFLLGRIRREQGRLDEAGSLLDEAIRQDPSFLFGWLELIRCRAVEDRWADVGNLLERAGSLFGQDDPLLAKENLRYLMKTAQLEAAVRQSLDLVRQFPHWTEISALSERLRRLADPNGNTRNT